MGLFTSQMQLQLQLDVQIRIQIRIRRQILIPDTFNVRIVVRDAIAKTESSSISSYSSLSSTSSSSLGRKHHQLADKSLTAARSQTNRRTVAPWDSETIGYIKVAPPTRNHMKSEFHMANIVARGHGAWSMGQAEAATMKAMNE